MKRPTRHIIILKPPEFQALLRNANPETLPAIVLGGFCGLRPGEIHSLDWAAIDFANKTVLVEGGVKIFYRRMVPLPDAAAAWLTPVAKDSGRVVHHRSLRAFFFATDQVWKSTGVKRRPNILRLSMMSYLFASTNDASKTASELGTSPQLLEAHFRKSTSTRDAEAWFAIFPSEQKPAEPGPQIEPPAPTTT